MHPVAFPSAHPCCVIADALLARSITGNIPTLGAPSIIGPALTIRPLLLNS